jgi:hypothetical protein
MIFRFAAATKPSRRWAGLAGALLWLAAAAPVPTLFAQAPRPEATLVLDRFDDLEPWKASASDGVTASIRSADGVGGRALRLDFDLGGTAGYAGAARTLPLELPPNYELTFWLRADAPVNDLQIKLVDASGDNVWWFHRRNFEFPREWRQVRIKKRQIEFAWGPTQDRELHRATKLELVIAAGRGGGSGTIEFSDLVLRELPPVPAIWPTPSVRASSSLTGAEAALALDGNTATAWRSDPKAGIAQTLTIDFTQPREFGGLIVRWQERAYASRYEVQFSDDGEDWRTVRSVTEGRGGPDALLLADAETRFVRLLLHAGPAPRYGIAELEIQDLAFGASPNAFFQALARDSPHGHYPRGISGEQPYWTIVGVDGGADSGLLSEDGALEVASGGFSVEPLVVDGSRVTTWADVASTQSLADGYLPLPSVAWRHADWRLTVTAFASGTRERSQLVARYEVVNVSDHPLSLRLVLAVRPFQVNPPAQFLNVEGGVSGVRDVRWNDARLTINGERVVYPLPAPDRVGMAPFDVGPVPKWAAGDWPDVRDVHDTFGYASAAIGYDIPLAAGASATVAVVVPLSGVAAAPAATLAGETLRTWIAHEQGAVAASWREKLNRVSFDVPPSAQPLVDTMRTALAHLLMIRDGAILRPGTRAYARSWIRDGAMMSEALLRVGHADAATSYLRWFAPHQFADGKVPCCVDARGADPVTENDSDGEFLFLVDEIHRYTHDRALQEAMWPHVVAAMRHLEELRESGRTATNLASDRRAFYGLVPASISHEGYSAKPMHSYWDDFWAAKGYDAAIDLARAQGATTLAKQWRVARDEFRRDLRASLLASTAAHGITYLPGAAELGDFDPTSTAIAFAPGADVLDPTSERVQATYERYWREFVERRDGRVAWEEYTPYELRVVGTFVRLGWRERAQDLLAFFLADRRPQAWNQWAEVIGRSYRQPRFIGDMPHGWVASDYIRSMLDLFAYERDADHALVLGRGIPPSWLEGQGVAVRNLRTPYGLLSYSLRKDRGRTILTIDALSGLPPGGFVLNAPGKLGPRATINGKAVKWREGELRIAELPATVVVNER